MKQLELSETDYWKLTLQSVDAALSMLSAFDGRHIEEIDTAIKSLRNLLAMGDDFDTAKRHPQQQQKQDSKNNIIRPYYAFNEMAVSEDNYQRRLQKAIELSIREYDAQQRNAQKKTSETDDSQNAQSSQYSNLNTELACDDRQFAQDLKTAIELSLKDDIEKKKAHETETHRGTNTSDQRDGGPITSEQHTIGILTSNATHQQENSTKTSAYKTSHSKWSDYDPLFEGDEPLSDHDHLIWQPHTANNAKVNKKSTESKPEALLADAFFPTVSAPVPVRHRVPAILQTQEQNLQQESNTIQESNRQSQPLLQSLRQYRQQAQQKQKLLCQYQQETLPQPVKFTPRGNGILSTESTASSERSSPAICTKTVTGFESKPRKMKIFNHLLHRGVLDSQQGVLEWANASGAAASWNSFASSTDTKWKLGIDTEISEWEKEQAKNKAATTSRLSGSPPQGDPVPGANKNASCSIKPDTCICDDLISLEDEAEEDNWSKEQERPDTMMIFIPQYPIRESKGRRRVFHPDDGDFESDSEEDEKEDEMDD
ncbi:hypothetical protein MBANPS3_000490 [Mucor bainieri]